MFGIESGEHIYGGQTRQHFGLVTQAIDGSSKCGHGPGESPGMVAGAFDELGPYPWMFLPQDRVNVQRCLPRIPAAQDEWL